MKLQFDLLVESILNPVLLEAEQAIIQEISDKAEMIKKERTDALVKKDKNTVDQKTGELVILRTHLKDELEKPTRYRTKPLNLSDQDIDNYIIDPNIEGEDGKQKQQKTTMYPGLYFLHSDNLRHFKAQITK